jgi:site-specific DNA-methyltransferase (adenine-specific)
VIDEYREGVQRGDTFPAVTVFFDGTQYYLVDGFHRYYAYRLEHIETIEAEIHQGSRRDAHLFSAATNQRHGLRRSNNDKWRAVQILLEDAEWRTWSDNAIAKHCGVAQSFVAKVRASLHSELSETSTRTYRNKYGNRSTMQTANIGRRPGQRPEPILPTTHVLAHVRNLVQSYELTYPGLQVEYEEQRHALTIRVTESKHTATQVSVTDSRPSLEPFLNQVIQGDCLDVLPTIPSDSVPIIISDPPFNIGIEYSGDYQDNKPYCEYLEWLRECLTELYRIGTLDCRLCLNVATDTSKGGVNRSLYSDVLQVAKQIGFQYRSEITWRLPVFKCQAIGSWASASSPNVICPVERIMLLYKHQWQKQHIGISDDLSTDFLHLVQGLWVVDPEDRQDVSLHLAKLPLAIPLNLIKLLSYKDDVVLDPFGGSGSVAVAAKQLRGPFILIEQAEQYCEAAKERLAQVA